MAGWLLSVALASHTGDLTYYAITNRMSSLRDWAYEPTYTATSNKYCKGYADVGDHPDAVVRSHGCHQKCSADPNHADCTRSSSARATMWASGSNFLCAPLATLQDLCTSMDSCIGVTWAKSTNAGMLSTTDCTMMMSNSYAFYSKVLPETPTCALGKGREIASSSHMHPEVEGLYELDEDGDSYTQVQPAGNAQIVWDAAHCGWIIQLDLTTAVSVPAAVPGCEDDNDAANAAFQNTMETADPDICRNVAAVWGEGTYCTNSIFKAMCAASCGQTCADSDEAAGEYWHLMLGEGPATCADLNCDDIVVSAICRDTCSHRRLAHSAAKLQKTMLEDRFRRAMRDHKLNAVAAKHRGSLREQHRRLNMNGQFEQIYYTFPHAQASCGSTPNHALLDIDGLQTSLYDMKSWDVATRHSMHLACPSQHRYSITEPDTFCTRQNIAAPYNSEASVVNNACYRKCTLLGGTVADDGSMAAKTTNSIDDMGLNDWCGGNQPDFTAMTNALCLPREDCEALCDDLDECVSFDMHKTLPQCYLNLGECSNETTADANFDIISRVGTPDETTACESDQARDTYITYTGAKFGGNSTDPADFFGTEFSSTTRTQCELECSALQCYGFTFEALNSKCTLYDVLDTPPPMLSDGSPDLSEGWLETSLAQSLTSVVWRRSFATCTITVHAEDARSAEAAFAGLYTELVEGSLDAAAAIKGTFLRADNRTRVRYSTDGAGCDGWVYEDNNKSVTEVNLYNCSDFPDAANLFLAQTQEYTTTTAPPSPAPTASPTLSPTPAPTDPNATILPTPIPTAGQTPAPTPEPTAIPFMGEKEHSCQWGAAMGWCDKSVVFAGACAHTCTSFKVVSYPDDSGYPANYAYQTETENGDDFACHGDNDAAMPELAGMYGISGTVSTCLEVATGDWHNYTHAPCQYGEISVLMNALCKQTCMSVEMKYQPDQVVSITDESDPQGAVYGQRMLFEKGRRLDGLTTSYGGRVGTHLALYYLDGLADESFWTARFRSFAHGSCPSLDGALGMTQVACDAVNPASMFYIETPTDPGTVVMDVCRDASLCPELTSCAMAANRFSDEIDTFRQAGLLGRNEWLSSKSDADREAVMGNFVPKTITTDTRAESYVVAAKADFAGEVYRTVPGATRVRLHHGADAGFADRESRAIITLAPATAGEGVFSIAELDRSYTSSEYWGAWTTDVVRIERFDAAGRVRPDGPFVFELWEPSEALTIFAFPRGEEHGTDIERLGGSVVAGNDGWWTVTVPSVDADFVGTTDIDECANGNGPCDNNAECGNQVGAAPTCTCVAGYVGSGLVDDCVLAPAAYSAGHQDYYFRLQHDDRLDYGWRIQDIRMYTDVGCKREATFASSMVPLPGPAGCPGDDCTDETYLTITSATNVYTGPKAHSHYPGQQEQKYWNGNLFDRNTDTEWWSASLNLNPEVSDSSQRGAQTIDWIVRGDVVIQCVKVDQHSMHMSHNMTLTRGPASVAGRDCGMSPGQEPCEATMSWSLTNAAQEDKFVTSCGEADTQYFGEILALETTTEGGWFGSYANDNPVPSSCHCHALCVAHVAEGCRSYKFYDAGNVKHCYLQSNIFETGEGWHGVGKARWTGWRSGTPGRRTLGFSPGVVIPGQEFDLTISGVGLPYSTDDNFNTAPRQRIKIVEESQDCAEQPPEEVYGIGCSETTRTVQTAYGTKTQNVFTICSPRPISADAEHVTYGPLSITSSSESKVYKVCYCATKCYEPSSYSVVPGRISMASSSFLWDVTPKVVTRKVNNGPTEITLRVARPSFGSYSGAHTWELKVVRDYFGCSVNPDTTKFICLAAQRPGNPADLQGPSLLLPSYTPPEVNGSYPSVPLNGIVVLDFDEDVTTEGCTGGFTLKQADVADQFVSCANAVVEQERVLLRFSTVVDQALHRVVVDAGAVKDLSGNANTRQEYPATDGWYQFMASEPSVPDVVFSQPADGANFVGSSVTVYLSRDDIDTAGNTTFEECTNNVCGSGGRAIPHELDATGYTVTISFEAGGNASMVYGRRYRLTIPVGSISMGPGLEAGPAVDRHVEFVYGCGVASYVDSPDSAAWKFQLELDVEDAGSYTVCFREPGGEFAPIPAQDSLYLEIEKLQADKTHPRGIFHNQYFSALAGAVKPLNLTVAGTRVAVPTDSKVVINRDPRGVCGDISKFDGVRVRPTAKSETVQPVLERFEPTTGATIDPSQGIVLVFSETVRLADACDGENGTQPLITFTPTDGTDDVSFSCGDAMVDRARVVLNSPSVSLDTGKTYYLQVGWGALEDLAGNSPGFIITDGTYEVSTASETGSVGPEIVSSLPADGAEHPLDGGVVTLFLSSRGTSRSGSGNIYLTDCGDDFLCGTDDDSLEHVFVSQDLTYSSSGLYHYATVPVGRNLDDGHRFKMEVPQSFMESTGSTADAGPSGKYSFEFIKNTANYNYYDMVMAASAYDSTEDALVFGVQLRGDMVEPSDSYTLCYCNDQDDDSLEDLGDGETTYRLTEDALCPVAMVAPATVQLHDRSVADHQCEAKCSHGCTGPYCYCDGYVAGASASTLCLPAGECRAACDLSDDCGGINVHDSLPQCTLLPVDSPCLATFNTTGVFEVDEEFLVFTKQHGTACTNLADFQERAGSLFVTTRVEVAVDYVLHPGKDGSVELTSPQYAEGEAPMVQNNLTYEHDAVFNFEATRLLSRDRITVIDCKGTCGVSSPTTAIVVPANGDKIQTWNDFVPFSWFVDYPHVDAQNEVDPETNMEYAMPKTRDVAYTEQEGQFCPRANIGLDAEVSFDGTMQALKGHQCYTKCSLQAPCEGDDCHCDGHYPGYDGLDSNALCADQTLCEYLCDQLDDCTSIDMHANLPRCFLNTASECRRNVNFVHDITGTDPSYNLLMKSEDPNDSNHGGRRLEPQRSLLPASDFGFSWESMLRFKPLQFKSGGTFKLCFCDSTIPTPHACSTEKDYKIEVGTIHASGVSCLIANPQLQRVSCATQFHGGLRCYRHVEAPEPEPPLVVATAFSADAATAALQYNTKCLYMPQEQADQDPDCQGVSGYQGTLGRRTTSM